MINVAFMRFPPIIPLLFRLQTGGISVSIAQSLPRFNRFRPAGLLSFA